MEINTDNILQVMIIVVEHESSSSSSSSSSGSGSSSSISSSSSTQRSPRGPVDEMHVFQKKVFSPRPEATFQVNFNAKAHLFNMKCKETENGCRLGEMHLFEFTFILYKRLSKKRALA